MRFSTLAFAAVAAVATAQNLGDIPQCALSCFALAVPASGCSLTDQKCQCSTGQQKIQEEITKCVPGKCSTDDIAKISPAVSKICLAAGYTLSNLPTAVSSGSSSAKSTGSASATTTGSASKTSSGSGSATSEPAQSTGGAVANGVGMGALALGMAAVFGI